MNLYNIKCVCLSQVKLLDGPAFTHSSVAEFLNRAVQAPPAVSVQNAVRLLQVESFTNTMLSICELLVSVLRHR